MGMTEKQFPELLPRDLGNSEMPLPGAVEFVDDGARHRNLLSGLRKQPGKEVVERRRDLCKRHETDAILGRAPIAGREGPEGAAPLRVGREDLCQKVGPSRRRAENGGFAHERAGCRWIEIDGLERRRPARTRILK